MNQNSILGQLPLTPLSVHILLSLADQERHGYAIMKEIERITGGVGSSATGPIYIAAQRLLETGLIVESDRRPDPELDDQRRKYYRLTDLGREVAVAEVRRMAQLVEVAKAKKLFEG